jgi:phosphohistidine phosphatase
MIRLLVIRHAKSSWAEPAQRDLYRPLNERGRRSADAIGRWMQARGLVPGHALVSTATRTQETWRRIEAVIGPVPTALVPDLYEAAPKTMLRVLRAAPRVPLLALVGHQPGIGALAGQLLGAVPDAGSGPDEGWDAEAAGEFARYPTAATALIEFDAGLWSEVDWGKGRLAAFVLPRRLEAA